MLFMVEKILKLIFIDDKELSYKGMMKYFNISDRKLFNKSIDKLQREKVIFKNSNGKYEKSLDDIYFGVFESTQKGFGFLLMKDERDIFISRDSINGAMNSDKVIVKLIPSECSDRRKVGEIIYVVERNNDEIIGEFKDSKFFGFVIPKNLNLNYDIYVPSKFKLRAKDGDIVVVKIYKWSVEGRKPEGRIIEILGKKDSKDINFSILLRKYNLKKNFPHNLVKSLEKIENNISDYERFSRRDLRNLPIVTIDGVDAKDLDDAVYVERDGENYKLSVHIADVSYYVRFNTPLDREAFKRGTSVYLVNDVIPMLPKVLSNDLCSLNPNTDKLTLSCEMVIDKCGKVLRYDIFESIINTKYRLSYDEVQSIIDGDNIYSDIKEMVFCMKELAEILQIKRYKRGAINLDFPECKISFCDGKASDISPFYRSFSHQIIEEFMLVCNETIAEYMYFLKAPFVYRIHEEPDMQKIFTLSDILNNLNYNLKISDKVYSNQIQNVLDFFKGKDEELFLSRFILRSMSKAKYSTECIGHFGLATRYYCHFTSPIRRYPDLLAHRILKIVIKGGLDESIISNFTDYFSNACLVSSEREKVAEEAEREVQDIYKAEFMKDKIGQEFDGIISSVTQFGFFVELLNMVRGLVHIKDLDGDYYFDEKNICLFERNGNGVFKIGKKVKVIVDNVILDNNEIYFVLGEGGE